MKRCLCCNRAYSDAVKVCSVCGTNLSGNAAPVRHQSSQNHIQDNNKMDQHGKTAVRQGINVPTKDNQTDNGKYILEFLRCFFNPIRGFSGYLLHKFYKNSDPLKAAASRDGAIACIVVVVLLMLFFI